MARRQLRLTAEAKIHRCRFLARPYRERRRNPPQYSVSVISPSRRGLPQKAVFRFGETSVERREKSQ